MSDITNIAVSAGNVVPVDTLGGQVTVKVNSGGPVYYADNAQVSSTNNQGSITAGNSSTFSAPQFITAAAGVQASVTLTLFAGSSTAPGAPQDVVLGSDGTLGGAGGTPLTTLDKVPGAVADVSLHSHKLTAVADATAATDALNQESGDARYAIVSSPNTFTAAETITPASGTAAALNLNGTANQLQLTQTTDWGANLTGQTTYDSLDIFHKSAGDGVYIVHAGGVSQAKLLTGTVAANNGITYMAIPSLSGTAQNAITVRHLVAGLNTALSVSVSSSAVTVNVATDGSGNPTSTAAQVIAAVNASTTAYALVSAYNTTTSAGTSTGVGVVASVAATNLAGGFTGSTPGADSALNPYIPFWLDDVGSGTGTSVGYRQGRRAMIAYNNAAYDPQGVCFSVNHAAGGPAIQLNNQSPTQYGCPQVAGNGIALHLNDYSTAPSINIIRNTAPTAGNSAAAFTYQPAVISVTSAASGTFPVLISTHSGDSLGVYVRNDGNACFGLNQNPALGRVQIDSNSATTANCLTLSNANATADAGCALNVLGPSNVTTFQIATDNIDANNTKVNFQVRSSGALALPVQLRGTSILVFATLAMQDAVNVSAGTTTGTKIGTATTQKLGFFNSAPVVQPSAVGAATGFTAGATVATFHSDDTYTGNTGSTAYTINGVVAALKNLGLIAA